MILHYFGQKGGGAQFTRHIALGFQINGKQCSLEINRNNELFEDTIKLCKLVNTLPLPRNIKELSHSPLFVFALMKWSKRSEFATSTNIRLITMVSPMDLLLLPVWLFRRDSLACVIHDWKWRQGVSRIGLFITHVFANISNKVVVLSDSVGKEVLQDYPKWISKIVYSTHGPFLYDVQVHRSKNCRFRLVHFGRIAPSKGIERMLRLAKGLEFENQNVRVEIWGEGDLTPFRKQLKELKNIRIENRWISELEIPKIFESECILCALYNDASQSGVVPMAIGMGVPVLVSNVGGLPSQVMHGINGWVAPNEEQDVVSMLLNVPLKWKYARNNPWPEIVEKLESDLEKTNHGA